MENPATWGPAEHIVRKVLDEARNVLPEFRCGLSLERRITDALREAGLLQEERKVVAGKVMTPQQARDMLDAATEAVRKIKARNDGEEEADRRADPEHPDQGAGRPAGPEVRDETLVR